MALAIESRLRRLERAIPRPRQAPPVPDWLLSLLKDWPTKLLVGKVVWCRPSEALDLVPDVPSARGPESLCDADALKPYRKTVTPERIGEIRAVCCEIAGRAVRAEETLKSAMRQLPQEALEALLTLRPHDPHSILSPDAAPMRAF